MAIGGFDGTTYLKTCEIYDADANMWKLSCSMIYRRLGGGVGVVKMTKEASTSGSTTSSGCGGVNHHMNENNNNRNQSTVSISSNPQQQN